MTTRKTRRARFDVFQGKDGDWYWTVIARNGERVCQSEGYKNKANAKRATERLPWIVDEAAEQAAGIFD